MGQFAHPLAALFTGASSGFERGQQRKERRSAEERQRKAEAEAFERLIAGAAARAAQGEFTREFQTPPGDLPHALSFIGQQAAFPERTSTLTQNEALTEAQQAQPGLTLPGATEEIRSLLTPQGQVLRRGERAVAEATREAPPSPVRRGGGRNTDFSIRLKRAKDLVSAVAKEKAGTKGRLKGVTLTREDLATVIQVLERDLGRDLTEEELRAAGNAILTQGSSAPEG